MRSFFSNAILLITIAFFCTCCSGPKNKSITAPESGEFCYKADTSREYLQLVIKDGKVEGKLLNTTEDEILVKLFSGEVVPESNKQASTNMNVTVSYVDVSEDKTWVMWFEEDGLSIKFNNDFLHYTKIPNDSVARLYKRLNETILTYKSTGFIVPKGEPVCYKSVSPNASKRTDLYELFQLWSKDGKLKGRGAGYYLGDPVWDFDFHGTMTGNDMNVTVNYRKTGEAQHTVLETWKIDPKDHNRIYIKNYPRTVLGAREYVETGNEDFLNFVHSYFEKEDLVR